MKTLLASAFLLLLAPMAASATDTNPWAQHYAQRDAYAQDMAEAGMPAALPSVEDALSTARRQTGMENSISAAAVENAVANALKKEGAGEQLRASLNKGAQNGIVLRNASPLTFQVSGLQYNATSLSWEALCTPYAGNQPLTPVKIAGTYDEVLEVPVLSHRIQRDEVITDADIAWQKIDASRLRNDTAMQPEQLVGMTPRRTLSPNRSIRLAELARPSVVRKNEQVAVQFRSGSMELRTLGEAMEDGAKGDIIRIRNKDSKQPIQARVLAAGLAEAMPMGVLAQAN